LLEKKEELQKFAMKKVIDSSTRFMRVSSNRIKFGVVVSFSFDGGSMSNDSSRAEMNKIIR
jgi:hypothetical protein